MEGYDQQIKEIHLTDLHPVDHCYCCGGVRGTSKGLYFHMSGNTDVCLLLVQSELRTLRAEDIQEVGQGGLLMLIVHLSFMLFDLLITE